MTENDLLPYDLVRSMLEHGEGDIYRTVIEGVDRRLITELIRQCAGNQSAAAKVLGLSRMTLRVKLRSLGLLR